MALAGAKDAIAVVVSDVMKELCSTVVRLHALRYSTASLAGEAERPQKRISALAIQVVGIRHKLTIATKTIPNVVEYFDPVSRKLVLLTEARGKYERQRAVVLSETKGSLERVDMYSRGINETFNTFVRSITSSNSNCVPLAWDVCGVGLAPVWLRLDIFHIISLMGLKNISEVENRTDGIKMQVVKMRHSIEKTAAHCKRAETELREAMERPQQYTAERYHTPLYEQLIALLSAA
ncbi:hypothetical protein ERJ75_000676100 [Trypanosoma vivax]|nr:hypothetical protein TRVL_05113 [Trypanosoma vivax]KAH8614530.1 hypothetical protein ERJ75_000676100 [Trypanosoma vivax]